MDTAPRLLVTYATAAGSTADIAERVAEVLRTAGCAVDCRPAGPGVDPTGYDAVVVGSAVHNMAWLPPALDVLRRISASGRTSVWCFSVGGLVPRGRFTRFAATREAERVEQDFPTGLAVRDHRLFSGVVQTRGVPLWGRLFYRATGTRPGDHRNWPDIDDWARRVGAALREAPSRTDSERN